MLDCVRFSNAEEIAIVVIAKLPPWITGIPSTIYCISVRRLSSYITFRLITSPLNGSSTASILRLPVSLNRAGMMFSSLITSSFCDSERFTKSMPPSKPKANGSPGCRIPLSLFCPNKSPITVLYPGRSVLVLKPRFMFIFLRGDFLYIDAKLKTLFIVSERSF